MAVKFQWTCPKCEDAQKSKLPDGMVLKPNPKGNITFTTDCTWCGETVFISLQVNVQGLPF